MDETQAWNRYAKEFLPLYNEGEYIQAEEIARKYDLGEIIIKDNLQFSNILKFVQKESVRINLKGIQSFSKEEMEKGKVSKETRERSIALNEKAKTMVEYWGKYQNKEQ